MNSRQWRGIGEDGSHGDRFRLHELDDDTVNVVKVSSVSILTDAIRKGMRRVVTMLRLQQRRRLAVSVEISSIRVVRRHVATRQSGVCRVNERQC